MADKPDFHDVIKGYQDFADEVVELISNLTGEDSVTRESIITAGLFAKLDMILDATENISRRLTVIESKLNEPNRVATWLGTIKNK